MLELSFEVRFQTPYSDYFITKFWDEVINPYLRLSPNLRLGLRLREESLDFLYAMIDNSDIPPTKTNDYGMLGITLLGCLNVEDVFPAAQYAFALLKGELNKISSKYNLIIDYDFEMDNYTGGKTDLICSTLQKDNKGNIDKPIQNFDMKKSLDELKLHL